MAATKEDICNLALSFIGSKAVMADITATNKTESVLCNAIYEDTKKSMLRAAHWNFASQTVALVANVEVPLRWTYNYDLPAGYLKGRFIVVEMPNPRLVNPPWEVALDQAGTAKLFFTDVEGAVLSYTMDVTDVALFDENFVEAFAMTLATRIAFPLRGTAVTSERVNELAILALHVANGVNQNEQGRDDTFVDAETTRSRG